MDISHSHTTIPISGAAQQRLDALNQYSLTSTNNRRSMPRVENNVQVNDRNQTSAFKRFSLADTGSSLNEVSRERRQIIQQQKDQSKREMNEMIQKQQTNETINNSMNKNNNNVVEQDSKNIIGHEMYDIKEYNNNENNVINENEENDEMDNVMPNEEHKYQTIKKKNSITKNTCQMSSILQCKQKIKMLINITQLNNNQYPNNLISMSTVLPASILILM